VRELVNARSALALALSLLLGCSSIERSWHEAYEDEDNNRWEQAYQRWVKIVAEGEREKRPDADLAGYYHNLGRTAGVTCRFDQSEQALLHSRDLYAKTDGASWNPLIELGRLELDQKKYAESARYFKQAFDAMERAHHTSEPRNRALILDDYAQALAASGDAAGAKAVREQAIALRKGAPPGAGISGRPPYGKFCPPATPQPATPQR
jgi:tetratricopeptide (TPR) repeat protein